MHLQNLVNTKQPIQPNSSNMKPKEEAMNMIEFLMLSLDSSILCKAAVGSNIDHSSEQSTDSTLLSLS